MKEHHFIAIRLLSAILCFVAFLTAIPPVVTYAEANATQTVRVGVFALDGYPMQDENGVRTDYSYEMLQHLAGHVELRYECDGYDKSWNDMQDMLANGAIDIATYTDARNGVKAALEK